MAIKDLKIKLKENKPDGGLNSPRYSLSFKQTLSNDESKSKSYEVLSALKGDNDIIIEVNSSLFNTPSSQRESYAMEFLDSIRELGLDYRYKKGISQASQSIISQLFGLNKNTYSHEILVYVPHSVWQSENFYQALPLHGARYYVPKEPMESGTILDDMSKMLDSEKLDYFKFSVFDSSTLGYMGISTSSLTLNDIKQLLGL